MFPFSGFRLVGLVLRLVAPTTNVTGVIEPAVSNESVVIRDGVAASTQLPRGIRLVARAVLRVLLVGLLKFRFPRYLLAVWFTRLV